MQTYLSYRCHKWHRRQSLLLILHLLTGQREQTPPTTIRTSPVIHYLNVSKCKLSFQYMTVKNKPGLLRKSDPHSVRMGQAEHRGPSSTTTAKLRNQCIAGLTATRKPSSHHIFWSGGSVTISQKQRFQGELAHYVMRTQIVPIREICWKQVSHGCCRLNLWTLHV